MLFTKNFWKQASELAIRGGAQMLLVGWAVGEGAERAGAVDAFSLNYQLGLGYFLGGIVVSLVTSVAAGQINVKSSPMVTMDTAKDLPSKL